jgi:hypothetical protein
LGYSAGAADPQTGAFRAKTLFPSSSSGLSTMLDLISEAHAHLIRSASPERQEMKSPNGDPCHAIGQPLAFKFSIRAHRQPALSGKLSLSRPASQRYYKRSAPPTEHNLLLAIILIAD